MTHLIYEKQTVCFEIYLQTVIQGNKQNKRKIESCGAYTITETIIMVSVIVNYNSQKFSYSNINLICKLTICKLGLNNNLHTMTFVRMF